MMPPSLPPDIEAEVRFLSTEEGGKTIPCRSGYRPNHDFGIEGALNDAHHDFPDGAEVRPGDTARSLMSFLDPEAQRGRLYEGFTFTVQEGRRVIGQGRITKVLNQDLLRR
jgi:translation elongation factor EF-Tu-like GTPase